MTNNSYPYPTPKLPKKLQSSKFKKLGSLNNIISEDSTTDISFDSKICYNELPTAVKSKSLSNLNKIIRPDGFRKINLNLVYRRCSNSPFVGKK